MPFDHTYKNKILGPSLTVKLTKHDELLALKRTVEGNHSVLSRSVDELTEENRKFARNDNEIKKAIKDKAESFSAELGRLDERIEAFEKRPTFQIKDVENDVANMFSRQFEKFDGKCREYQEKSGELKKEWEEVERYFAEKKKEWVKFEEFFSSLELESAHWKEFSRCTGDSLEGLEKELGILHKKIGNYERWMREMNASGIASFWKRLRWLFLGNS